MSAIRTRSSHLDALLALTFGLGALVLGGPLSQTPARAHAGGPTGDDDANGGTGGGADADDIAACLKHGGTPAPNTDGTFDGLATCELPGAFD